MYQPAGNLTSTPGLRHLATVYYDKTGLDRLMKKFIFRTVCDKSSGLPKKAGDTVQFFRYNNFSAQTTPTVEGHVGTSQTMSSNIVAARVSQYTSFITVSDFLDDTSITDELRAASELLGYQAGLSVDTITRGVIDSQSASTDVTLDSPDGYLKVSDLRGIAAVLEANDVPRFDNGYFKTVIHPYLKYDLVNDPAAGGLADIFKYTNPEKAGLVTTTDRGHLVSVADNDIYISTNVLEQSGPNRYRGYTFGYRAIGCVDLAGRGPSNVEDPKRQRFQINTYRAAGPSVADPEHVMAGFASYNFVFTTVILQGPTHIPGPYRYRTFDAQSSVA